MKAKSQRSTAYSRANRNREACQCFSCAVKPVEENVAIAHIGFLFSSLAANTRLAFFRSSRRIGDFRTPESLP
jgi:hypothetical protein